MTAATVAVVHAAALRHNLQRVRDLAPGCPVMAVVKANAYGHGAAAVARTLRDVDAFAVARIEEGIQLREAGISTRIVLLGGVVTMAEAREAVAHRLDLVVHSLWQVDLLESAPGLGPLDLWLKADTGMGRLGLGPADTADARRRLLAWRGCGTLRLMTHFASADNLALDATVTQLAGFRRLTQDWAGDISLANSAAILQWPESVRAVTAKNWVRPGLMLYGASPVSGRSAASFGLKPAMSFEARLIAVKSLPAGHRVGYGGDWQCEQESLVGVVAAGYADGYPWHVSRGTPVMVNGWRTRVLGRVSMDMVSVDLTGGPPSAPGDRVLLWGDGLPVEEIASCAGRIPYELLTDISPRVARQFRD
ncbi:MAG: alanine racemase [Gammaproteobacteria bacterium]|nr:MAG: alanine racemase [Gammaproteobacteria bacterium]